MSDYLSLSEKELEYLKSCEVAKKIKIRKNGRVIKIKEIYEKN